MSPLSVWEHELTANAAAVPAAIFMKLRREMPLCSIFCDLFSTIFIIGL